MDKMANPRFHVKKVGTQRVIAWFDDIFYAYNFVEAIATDRLNAGLEYTIVDTAVSMDKEAV
jgi:hypothetical protein